MAVDGASLMNPMIKPESNFLGPCVVSTVLAIRYLVQIFAYLCTISAFDAPLWAKGAFRMVATGYIPNPQFSNLLLSLLISRHPPTNLVSSPLYVIITV